MTVVVGKIAALLILVAVGAVVSRARRLDESALGAVSVLVVDVAMPVLAFHVLATASRPLLLRLWFVPLFAVGVIAAGLAAGCCVFLAAGASRALRVTFIQAAGFANTGFLAIPLLYALFGAAGAGCAVVFNIGYSLCWWSVGILLLESIRRERPAVLLGRVFNTGFVAALAGLGIGLAQLRLPAVLLDVTGMVGQMTIPLAMVALGMMLAGAGRRGGREPGLLAALAAIRLAAVPAAVWLVLARVPGIDGSLRCCLVLLAGMPCASSAPLFVQKYGGDVSFAVGAVFTTTLAAAVSLPAWVALLYR